MKVELMALAVMAAVCGTGAENVSGAVNMIANPGFEAAKPQEGWCLPGAKCWKVAAGEGRGGSHALVWENADRNHYSFPVYRVKFEPGGVYRFGCWVKVDGTNAPKPNVGIDWSDANGKWLNGSPASPVIGNETGTEGWIRYEGVSEPLGPSTARGNMLVYFGRGSTGRVRFDDFTLVAEPSQPIEFMQTSAYHDTFARTDRSLRIVVSLHVNPVRTPLDSLRAEFVIRSSAGDERAMPADVFDLVHAEKRLAPSDFVKGEYTVSFRLVKKADGAELASVSRKLVCTERPVKRRVAIDSFGRASLEGKPFFPLGMYVSRMSDEDLERYKRGPFNFAMQYGAMTANDLDRWQSIGVYAASDVRSLIHGYDYSAKSKFRTAAESEAAFREKVSTLGRHPALFAWYLVDEAPLKFVPNITHANEYLHEIDPDHPTYTVTDKPWHSRSLMPCYDVIGMDPYPIGNHGARADISICSGWAEETRAGMFDLRPMWHVPQTFNWGWYRPDEIGTPGVRMPTRAEMANMTWQGVAAGANGLCSYAFHAIYKRAEPAERDRIWGEVCEVAKEVKSVEATLLAEPGCTLRGVDRKLTVRTYRREGRDFALVVNRTAGPVSAKLTAPYAVREARIVLGSGVKCAEGALAVDFQGLGYALVELVPDWGKAEGMPLWNGLKAAAVRPMSDNARAVDMGEGRFILPVELDGLKCDRACWDFPMKVDLRRANAISFDFMCPDLAPYSGFSIYLKSGDGWYTGKFAPACTGVWHRVTIAKSDLGGCEGTPAGWRNIELVRIGAWRNQNVGAGRMEFGAGAMTASVMDRPEVVVVRGDSCVAKAGGGDKKSFGEFAAATDAALSEAGATVLEISDTDFEPDDFKGTRLVVFPYNPRVPAGIVAALKDFVAGGGKVLACHSLDAAARKLVGTDEEWYKHRNWRGRAEKPVPTANGFHIAHVWRYGIEDSREHAFAILCAVAPDLKPRLEAKRAAAAKRAAEAAAEVARMPGKRGEWRAFWCHSERGLGGTNDWDSSIRFLKANGFTAIIPNLSWAGKAYYESKAMPTDAGVAKEGDALKACLAACRKYGVECHVWHVCWNTGSRADKEFCQRIRETGRAQKSFSGKDDGKVWLCPSHPENLSLEIEGFVELAKLGVDGIHFDYIRYPDGNHCFCEGCRERFEKFLGRKVEDWPKDVRKDGMVAERWKEFRCANITALVKGVHERVRKECPKVQLSAAVFHNPDRDPYTVGQDWASWCQEGYLDFVCPMDYYGGSNMVFEGLVESQRKAIAGTKASLRPGLGLSCWKNVDNDAYTMSKQIDIVRKAGLDGFTVFNYDARAVAVLPTLHAGPTRE